MLSSVIKPFLATKQGFLYPSFITCSKSLHSHYKQYFGVLQFDPSKDYYKILDVNKSANAAEIKKSFYKLAKKYHPDLNKSNGDKFKEISEAWDVLSDESKKRDYDSARSYSSGPSGSSSSGYNSSQRYGGGYQ